MAVRRRGGGSCLSDLGQPGNRKRLCLLALHYACLVVAAVCSVCSACRLEAWQRLVCGAGDAALTAAGGPAGLDFALTGSGGGVVNASDAFGLAMGPVLEQLANDSKAWASIGWLLAASSVTTVSTLVVVILKKFCGRARALAMTFVVALLILISTAELLSAMAVFLSASQRLRALFDSVATAAARRVAISGRSDVPTPAGFALATSAAFACLADLALLALKRLGFSRRAYDLQEPPPPPTTAATTTPQRAPPTAQVTATAAAAAPSGSAVQPPPPPMPVRGRRLTSLAAASGQVADAGASNAGKGDDKSGGGPAEQLRRRLERRQESERRRQPAKVASAATAVSAAGDAGGGADNLGMTPSEVELRVAEEDDGYEGVENDVSSTASICRTSKVADSVDAVTL